MKIFPFRKCDKMRSKIEIDKDKILYQFSIQLGGVYFQMEWQWNDTDQRFTCNLYDSYGNVLVYGEPLVLENPMFSPFLRGLTFPAPDLVPYDASGEATEITWDNFGETVFLTLDDEKDSD